MQTAGRRCGVVCHGPQPCLADFVPIGSDHGEFRSMSQPARRTSWATAATVAAVLALTAACSGGDDPDPKTAGSPTAAPTEVATAVSFGKITGRLPSAAR